MPVRFVTGRQLLLAQGSVSVQRRGARALSLVQMGELSSGRQALEGVDLAPGNDRTLAMLQDPASVLLGFVWGTSCPDVSWNSRQ